MIKLWKSVPDILLVLPPRCPLDFYQDQRVKLEDEEKCSMAKSIRMRIAKGTQLKYQGMTKREWEGKKRWNEKPEAEKQAIIKKGKEALKKINLDRQN